MGPVIETDGRMFSDIVCDTALRRYQSGAGFVGKSVKVRGSSRQQVVNNNYVYCNKLQASCIVYIFHSTLLYVDNDIRNQITKCCRGIREASHVSVTEGGAAF